MPTSLAFAAAAPLRRLRPASSRPAWRCGAARMSSAEDAAGADADADAPKLSQDWRSFRARLVSTEAPASSSRDGFWAHRVVQPESGCVLVARPEEVYDGFFSRSVVLLLSHGDDGTFGLCLNKPLANSLASVPTDSSSPIGEAFQIAKAECFAENALLSGGPVNEESLIMLHGANLASASQVTDGVYCGGLLGAIVAVRSGLLKSQRCRFFSGYSAWSGGQLEGEIERGAWHLAATSEKYILEYNLPPDNGDCMWRQIMSQIGDDPLHL
jgi:putative AlgH/UPF0301 family transcriptional regulator